MRRVLWLPMFFTLGLLTTQACAPAERQTAEDSSWTAEFRVEPGELSATGNNPYFILDPGYQLVLEDSEEQLTITVLDETKTVAGVETRVVEERETKNGQLVEVSRNYFAVSKLTNSVYYFGEDVDIYKGGEMVGHEGVWLAGVDDARFGLMMPGLPLLKARYYQEIAPDVALDRAEIVSVDASVETRAGEFASCLRVEETTPLDPDSRENKYYALGIGLVQEGSLKLVAYGKAEKPQ